MMWRLLSAAHNRAIAFISLCHLPCFRAAALFLYTNCVVAQLIKTCHWPDCCLQQPCLITVITTKCKNYCIRRKVRSCLWHALGAGNRCICIVWQHLIDQIRPLNRNASVWICFPSFQPDYWYANEVHVARIIFLPFCLMGWVCGPVDGEASTRGRVNARRRNYPANKVKGHWKGNLLGEFVAHLSSRAHQDDFYTVTSSYALTMFPTTLFQIPSTVAFSFTCNFVLLSAVSFRPQVKHYPVHKVTLEMVQRLSIHLRRRRGGSRSMPEQQRLHSGP